MADIEIEHETVVGKGTYSTVVRAVHRTLNQQFAVKRFERHLAEKMGPMIRREQATHGKLKHQNICRFYQSFEDTDFTYFLLELLEGGNLFRKLKKNKQGFTEELAFRYFADVLAGLQFLHENGLCHRDVKLENLLLDTEGNVKLCDFGTCAYFNSAERKTYCGTKAYMAPEMLEKSGHNEKVDVWSLGILLYEFCHGTKSPFCEKGQIRFKEGLTSEYCQLVRSLLMREV